MDLAEIATAILENCPICRFGTTYSCPNERHQQLWKALGVPCTLEELRKEIDELLNECCVKEELLNTAAEEMGLLKEQLRTFKEVTSEQGE